ncbi:hypothetical protein [Couchioplanes caeruleus]|uniref:Secreted protein n=2 Tax=Couchioplanes caeruleus TaxID=56438 RepID=A0A1K0G3S7_9ACTN|nr:hypothetical protein [Couchioplanes caeruleus]OJF11946.1 hypothetical protein BG844_23370 [Couchioplanes caeruleus subsp. caeruleus]
MAAAVVAATITGVAAPAAANTAASRVELAAGNGTHFNTASVTYKRVDGAVNSVKILTIRAQSAAHEGECVWVEWNDPNWPGGWAHLNSEPPCGGMDYIEELNRVIKAPAGHQLKVRLAVHHQFDVDLAHKDVAKLL